MTDSTKHLRDIVKEATGKGLKPFIEQVLNLNYGSFSYRHNAGKIHINDYLKISVITGKSIEELIGQDPRYKEALLQYQEDFKQFSVLKSVPTITTDNTDPVKTGEGILAKVEEPPPPPPKEEEEEDDQLNSGFTFQDV